MTDAQVVKLGQEVRDLVTGTEGIAVARSEYLNGCIRVCIQPKVKDRHDIAKEVEWADLQQVRVVGEGVRKEMNLDGATTSRTPTGGPPKSEAPAQ